MNEEEFYAKLQPMRVFGFNFKTKANHINFSKNFLNRKLAGMTLPTKRTKTLVRNRDGIRLTIYANKILPGKVL